jgi:hypothetical protein
MVNPLWNTSSAQAAVSGLFVLLVLALVIGLSKSTAMGNHGSEAGGSSRQTLKSAMEQVKGWTALAEQDTHPAVALTHNSHAAATLRMLRRFYGDRAVSAASQLNPAAYAEGLEEQQRGIFQALASACPPLQIPNKFVVATFPES